VSWLLFLITYRFGFFFLLDFLPSNINHLDIGSVKFFFNKRGELKERKLFDIFSQIKQLFWINVTDFIHIWMIKFVGHQKHHEKFLFRTFPHCKELLVKILRKQLVLNNWCFYFNWLNFGFWFSSWSYNTCGDYTFIKELQVS